MHSQECFSVSKYWEEFNKILFDIRAEFTALTEINANDIESRLGVLKSKVSTLQKYATEANDQLAPYDNRRSQEELEIINKELSTVLNKIQPKKKFTFSSRNKTKKSTSEIQETNDSLPLPIPPPLPVSKVVDQSGPNQPQNSMCLRNKENETIVLDGSVSADSNSPRLQLLVQSSTGCVISVKGVLGSVRLENLSNCQLYLGPCSTSIYLESCSNCVVLAASHQLRIHRSEGCRLFVRCRSHPIIEDCDAMLFAPYSGRYDAIDQDFKVAGLEEASCWDNVVDFKWHRNNVKSPHWDRLSSVDRNLAIPVEGWTLAETLETPSDAAKRGEMGGGEAIGEVVEI